MNDFESKSLKINCVGEELWLHPQRVMYWPARSTLFVADVHAGKEHAFARSGIAIPGGISDEGLYRLFTLCDAVQASTLMVLGDFMHTTPLSDESWLTTLSELLLKRPQLDMHIMTGNHDKAPGQSMIDKRIVWHQNPLQYGPFILQHEPQNNVDGYVLSGHLHPTWRLMATGHGSVRAPVFWFREQYAVLPAYGAFTGGMNIVPDSKKDQLYMVGEDCVLPIPANALNIGQAQRRR
ncbi:ligase-associated DNA damage response endonuclease PdeM [Granulosicoccus antarcticus]|uniref:Calcineurin-like phosphoesterase domain-containing protein n=1 Tax=Granulosicoccus antarcticus IMCC3135 TaxID=1192854 RepID=A0A2Z2NLZ9_9GAMM|nr:ligase-associated DNA damage response endonuclease PdeM [Granulosicoccus antarcticus]ASJ72356.1 hypothetical protein IMCC3135_11330 [Granulosicoccus antarcticus IMCC3135]